MVSSTFQTATANGSSYFNLTDMDISKYREDLSDQMAVTLLPVFVVLGLILLTGTIGNILVFYVYFLKFSPSSTRTAILALAFFDLITCAVCIPGEILDLRFSYSFSSQVLCRGFRAATTAMLTASGCTLLVVALDRYKRICHPLHEQLTSKAAWIRVIASCLTALAFASPAALVYGLSEVKTPKEGINGTECSTSQTSTSRTLRIAYNSVLCIVFLTAFCAMIIIYIFIGRQVHKQTHFRNSVQRRKGSSGSLRRQTICSDKFSNGDHSVTDGTKEASALHETIPENDTLSGTNTAVNPKSQANGHTDIKVTRKQSVLRHLRKMSHSVDIRTRKTTTMLFFITLIFVSSYLPHLVIKAFQATNKNFVDTLSTTGVIFYNIFVRSYFFNAAANAFVYGFCSPKFRHECRFLFIRLTFWVKSEKISVQNEDLMC